MSEPVKIASLELENVKRVRAVALQPAKDGLTVIGGGNAQGKTSVIDAIAWALGGNRRKPKRAAREGSATPPHLRVELSNGILVERKGEAGALRVTDPRGKRSGQALLDSFVGALALDLPKFMEMSDREKADQLMSLVGVGDELRKIDKEAKYLYNERTAVGRSERAARQSAEEMPLYADVPDEPVSASQLIREQQEILARNGENERKRSRVAEIGRDLDAAREVQSAIEEKIRIAELELAKAKQRVLDLSEDWMAANKTAQELRDESTAEVEAKLAEIDDLNEKVRANQRRADTEAAADAFKDERLRLTEKIERLRAQRTALLAGVDMPLEGLTVDEQGALVYRGSTWDDMSAAEQLRVATAVVRALKPECGFVLVDKLEQFDAGQLAAFGEWAEAEGLQIIGTRVASDDTCTVIIEDGKIAGNGLGAASKNAPSWADAGAAAPAEKRPASSHPSPVLIPGTF